MGWLDTFQCPTTPFFFLKLFPTFRKPCDKLTYNL